jgi:hypothetical protein
MRGDTPLKRAEFRWCEGDTQCSPLLSSNRSSGEKQPERTQNQVGTLSLASAPYWKNRAPTPVPGPLRDPALQDAIFVACDRMVGVG